MNYATRESLRFTEQCEALSAPDGPIAGGMKRLDEIRAAANWKVEHDIYESPEEPGTSIRVVKMKSFASVRLAYSIEEQDDGELFAIWESISLIAEDDPDLP